MRNLGENLFYCLCAVIGVVMFLIFFVAAVTGWLINAPVRKCLGYEYRSFRYFLNTLAGSPFHRQKGFRYGTWNPFHKSDWY